MIQYRWIRIKKRILQVSAISSIQYNPDKYELRVYEHNGYTNIVEVTEDKVTELFSVLNISNETLVLELGDK